MSELKKFLITGGCGFIGSNFIRTAMRNTSWDIINVDALTYAGNLVSLEDYTEEPRYKFIHADIRDSPLMAKIFTQNDEIDCVVNFAAETHVDRSIVSPSLFVQTNVLGTQNLLNLALEYKISKFVQVSTDEVYGSLQLDDPPFTEDHPIKPNSPYSASKASADHLVRAYFSTYELPAVITRCSNNYGPYQFPEKLIPHMILQAFEQKNLPIYGNGENVRDWIHVDDHCLGIIAAILKGKPGHVYNFGGEDEWSNLNVATSILEKITESESHIEFVADRPGHDFRYAVDISKSKRDLDWQPYKKLEDELFSVIEWYKTNKNWWKAILQGEHQKFIKNWYKDRVNEAVQ